MKPNSKSYKREIGRGKILIFLLALAVSVSAGTAVYSFLEKDVVIVDNGKVTKLKTFRKTVGEVLQGSGFSSQNGDLLNIKATKELDSFGTNTIVIKRALPITLFVEGKSYSKTTSADTVKDALKGLGYPLGDLDRLEGVDRDSKIVKGMEIKLIRVKEVKISEKTAIPFKTKRKADDRLDKGKEKIYVKGQQGIKEKLYSVIFEDGKQIAKKLVSEAVVSNPVTQLVHFGTVMNHKTARGDVIRYSKVMNMTATAYTNSLSDTGKEPGDPGYGITFSGMKTRKGVIAVDPRVIPIGTRLYIEVAGKTPDYGYAIAGDTGSAIKGNIVDLFYNTSKAANDFGRKRVKVYVLKD